jgi:hypothetical protein
MLQGRHLANIQGCVAFRGFVYKQVATLLVVYLVQLVVMRKQLRKRATLNFPDRMLQREFAKITMSGSGKLRTGPQTFNISSLK